MRGAHKHMELIDPVDEGGDVDPAGTPRSARHRRATMLEGADQVLEGVRQSLRAFQLTHSTATRHDVAFDALRKLHLLATEDTVPVEGDRQPSSARRREVEEQAVDELQRIAEADEGLLRSILPQLVAILLRRHPALARLEYFVVDWCSVSHTFATEVCWALLAELDPEGAPTVAERAQALLTKARGVAEDQLSGQAVKRTLSVPMGRRRSQSAAPPVTSAGGSASFRGPTATSTSGAARAATTSTAHPRPVEPVVANEHGPVVVPTSSTDQAKLTSGAADALTGVGARASGEAAGAAEGGGSGRRRLREVDVQAELSTISFNLKGVPRGKREEALRTSLADVDAHVQVASTPVQWHALPLRAPSQAPSGRPFCLARIVAEDARVFATKERVPYMVHVEVVEGPGDGQAADAGPARTRSGSTGARLDLASGTSTFVGKVGSTLKRGLRDAGDDLLALEAQLLGRASREGGEAPGSSPRAPAATRTSLRTPPPAAAADATGDPGGEGTEAATSGPAGTGAAPRGADASPGAPSSQDGAELAEPAASASAASSARASAVFLEEFAPGAADGTSRATGEAPAGSPRLPRPLAVGGPPPAIPADASAASAASEDEALRSLATRNVIQADVPGELSAADDVTWSGPSAKQGVFGETGAARARRLAQTSAHAHLPGWQVQSLVVKANDELRQEQFAMQLISAFDQIFTRAHLPLALRPYRIVATAPRAGLIEAVPDSVSLDSLKQRAPECPSLAAFFRSHFGGKRYKEYHVARLNFARSAAAYSIVCYLLQIKDRHNGNILVTNDGHLVHIDFGFLLSNSPGGNMNFESAPFKLTNEYVELLGGTHSPLFRYFRYLLVRGFVEARRHSDKLLQIVQTTYDFGGASWPCFRGGQAAVDGLRQRFEPHMSMQQYTNHVIRLISRAQGNFRTRCYDQYQYCCQGIVA